MIPSVEISHQECVRESQSPESAQRCEGTDAAAFVPFYEATGKRNGTLMVWRRKNFSIKFNYPWLLRISKEEFSVKEV